MSTESDSETSPFARIGVIGCGLIGGSLARAATAVAGVAEVVVTDRDPTVRRAATEEDLGRVVEDAEEVAEVTDLLVLAVPIDEVAGVARRVWSRMDRSGVLTDVGSVKERIVRELEEFSTGMAGPRAEFVGGHPMAGSEREGLAGADATLFQGATYVLTPTARSSPDAFNRLAGFLRLLGARVLAVDPGTHDRLVATVSHLPQLIASALMAFGAGAARTDPGILAMAGGGFRDTTRLAASSPELWVGIVRENRAAVLAALDGYVGRLAEVRSAVERGDWDTVEAFLVTAREARRQLPGKPIPERLVDLVIPVEDHPGALAAVTTALGSVGVNIEDLSMRHAGDARRGALIVAVAGHEAAEEAARTLARRGFACHLEPR